MYWADSFLLLPLFVKGFQPRSPTLQHTPLQQQAFWEEAKQNTDLHDGEIIRRLQDHYHELQEELFAVLAVEDDAGATQVSREIFRCAADLNQVKHYEQYLRFKELQDHLHQAQEEVHEAEEWVKRAHRKAASVDKATHTVESVDEIFDRDKQERGRNVSQAAHNCEEFAKNILLDAQFEQLQAELEYENAEELLKDLQNNKQLLQRSLEKIDAEEYLLDHWYQVELPKHQDFLKVAENAIRGDKWTDRDSPPQRSVSP